MNWQILCETTGSTPLHPDDQLDRLAQHFLDSDLPYRGVSFIQFARVPYQFGYCVNLQPYRVVSENGKVSFRAITTRAM